MDPRSISETLVQSGSTLDGFRAAFRSPTAAARLSNLAMELLAAKPVPRMEEAVACALASVEADDFNPEVWVNLSAVLDRIPGLEMAQVQAIEKAEVLGYRNPACDLNKSLAWMRLGQVDSALRLAQEAVDGFTDHKAVPGTFLTHLASCLARSGNRADAITVLDQAEAAFTRELNAFPDRNTPAALKLEHEYGYIFAMRGAILIRDGHWGQGLKDLRDRMWLYRVSEPWLAACKPRHWDLTESLNGKRVLVALEQGIGDQIHYCRLIQWLSSCYPQAHITIACTAQLIRILRSLEDGAGRRSFRVVADKHPDPVAGDYDVVVPVLSIMEARFQHGLPPAGDEPGIYLSAIYAPNMNTVGRWPLKKQGRLRVGIAWQGNPQHGNDWQRSARLEDFMGLAKAAAELNLPIDWVSLQMYQYKQEAPDWSPVDSWEGRTGVPIFNARPLLGDMHDTALCLLEHVDLVISVDTSIVHLAGAVGVPCWCLLAHMHDMRWDWEGRIYDTVCLITQPAPGPHNEVWDPVMAEVLTALRNTEAPDIYKRKEAVESV